MPVLKQSPGHILCQTFPLGEAPSPARCSPAVLCGGGALLHPARPPHLPSLTCCAMRAPSPPSSLRTRSCLRGLRASSRRCGWPSECLASWANKGRVSLRPGLVFPAHERWHRAVGRGAAGVSLPQGAEQYSFL